MLLASPLTNLLQSSTLLLPLDPMRLRTLAILFQAIFLGLLIYALALRLLARDLCRRYWRDFRGPQPDGATVDPAHLE